MIKIELKHIALKEDDNKKVGDILKNRLNISSRLLTKLKMNGKIFVNRTSVFSSYIVHQNDEISVKIQNYLMKKSVELINIGCNVILDWGFWTKEEREKTTKYYKDKNIDIKWHYIDVDLVTWNKNIEERNKKILNGEGGSDFYLDEGLMNKLLSKWEEPDKSEIDVWNKKRK